MFSDAKAKVLPELLFYLFDFRDIADMTLMWQVIYDSAELFFFFFFKIIGAIVFVTGGLGINYFAMLWKCSSAGGAT